MMREENLAKALEQNVSVYCLDVEKSALEARNATVIALGSANLLVTECKSTAFPFIEMKLILPDLTSFITCFLDCCLAAGLPTQDVFTTNHFTGVYFLSLL